jgi:hypothetical protein
MIILRGLLTSKFSSGLERASADLRQALSEQRRRFEEQHAHQIPSYD